MNRCLLSLVAVSLLAAGMPVYATITIDWVTVGNPGNAADTQVMKDGTTGYGAVGYQYNIGKYDVTNAQYAEFLNAKAASNPYSLYVTNMSSCGITRNGSSGSYTYSVTSGLENRPVVFVSWFDAARFSNWLANGQGNGSTETGSYTLNGATSGIKLANPGATIRLPTEDEWYKAAYYNGDTSTYSLYPNGGNSITTADANYGNSVGHSTDVGAYPGAPSPYGTFDQGGDIYQWNDAVIGSSRGMRGGTWAGTVSLLASSFRGSGAPPWEGENAVGFRVVSVPEPGATVLAIIASGMVLIRRKR